MRRVVGRYLFSFTMVVGAFALRMWLIPWTGTGAPFVLFFGVVMITSLAVGTGPGILAVGLSLPLASYTFVVHAGYSVLQAVFQSCLFSIDGGIAVYLTYRM